MPAVPFDRLPDDARLWVFAADRPLDDAQQADLLAHVDDFIARWAAHGAPVVGARELRHGRFLLVGADERATGVSGCSTDTLFRTLGELESRLGVTLRDSSLVFWRDAAGEVQTAPRAAFRERVRAGEVDADTPVFDNTAGTVGDVRGGRWELPMRASWHGRAFGAASTAGNRE
jgi:hypothetical protein